MSSAPRRGFAGVARQARAELGVTALGMQCFQEEPGAPFRGYGIMVFALDGHRVAGITGFAGYPELFPVFELPSELG